MNKNLVKSLQCVWLLLVTVSCAIDFDITDYTEASSTLNFENPEDFDFDPNFVEIKNNQISLKPLDLEHSGEDFTKGSHVGSHLSSGVLSTGLNSGSEKDIKNILNTKSSNLIGYWKFDELNLGSAPGGLDLEDFSGNDFHGAAFGTPSLSQNSKVLSSFGYDGVDDSISIPSSGRLNLNHSDNYSFMFWLRLPPDQIDFDNATNYIINKTQSANYPVQVRLANSTASNPGYLSFRRRSGGVSSIGGTNFSVNDSQWHHYTFQKNGSVMELFFDGKLINSWVDNTIDSGSFTGDLEIGSDTNYFKGNLDELAFFDVALTETEIQKVYIAQNTIFSDETHLSEDWTPKWNSIVGYWKMDGNWQDSSGHGLTGVPTNGTTFSNDSRVGALSGLFDGIDDEVVFGDVLDLESSPISISAWVKTKTLKTNSPLVDKLSSDGNYRLNQNLNGSYNFGIRDSSGSFEQVTSNFKAQPDQWVNVIITYNNANTGRIYINGSLDSEKNDFTVSRSNSSNNLLFGYTTNNGVNFHGNLEDVAVWDVELSARDVSTIYNRQKQKYASHYTSEVIDLGSVASTMPDLSWATSLPFGKELVGDFDNDGTPDSERSSGYHQEVFDFSLGLEGLWRFNESSGGSGPAGADIVDESGKGNFGFASGVLGYHQSGLLGQAVRFNGDDSKVQIPAASSLNNLGPMTISAWVRPQMGGETVGGRIMEKGTNDQGTLLYILTNVGRVAFSKIHSGGYVNRITENDFVKIGEWNHVVLTSDGSGLASGINIYANGLKALVFSNENDAIGLPVDDSAMDLYIGNRGSDDRTFMGDIDEVSLWSRELSYAEIQQLYRRGANRVKLQVKSCVDSSCNCKSFSSSPVGSVNDCDGDGIANADDHDDVHQAEFMGPGGDGTTYFSELMNRRPEDVTFDCDANTTDSNPGICVDDEIRLAGSPKPTSPLFSFDDYLGSVRPQPNQYLQYRVIMEADENTACDGDPCLPELTSVNLNPSGEPRFYGQVQTVTSKNGIRFDELQRIGVKNADTCAGFQLSPDGEVFYHFDGESWVDTAGGSENNSADVLSTQITSFSQRFAPGNLFFKVFLQSDDSTTPCSIGKINLDYRDENI